MKTTKFTGKNELIDNLIQTFEESEDITLVVDFTIASIFADEYNDPEEFEYWGVELSCEENIYYVSKVENDCFQIIPSEGSNNNTYLYNEAERVIILDDVYDEEMLDYIDSDDIEIYGIDSVYEDMDSKGECTCHCGCCNCYYENEELSEFEKLNDAQKDHLFTSLSDIEEIDLDEIAKICMTFYNDGVNSTLLKTREILATLEK